MTDINDEIQGILVELKQTVESKQAESAESKAKIESLESKLIELESKLQDNSKSELIKSELESKLLELSDNLKNMEKKVYRTTAIGGKEMETDIKDFGTFLRTNDLKYLRTDRDPDGGYLVPQELNNQIINKIIEISDLRKLARVVQISGKALDVDRRDSDMSVYFVGEGGSTTESAPQYGKIIIPANKMMAETRVTNELLADSAFDIIQDLNMRAAQKFAEKEGNAFLTGSGVNEPEGLMVASGTANVNSGNANLLTADAFFDMIGNFKYRNPVFIMNRKTFAAARKLKAGNGEYLLQQGFDGNFDMRLGGTAGNIAGIPVVLMQGMADVGAGNKPVALLDPQEAYLIVDRVGMRILRDDYTLAGEDKVKFIMSRRVGGAVVNPDAVVIMTISA